MDGVDHSEDAVESLRDLFKPTPEQQSEAERREGMNVRFSCIEQIANVLRVPYDGDGRGGVAQYIIEQAEVLYKYVQDGLAVKA